MKSLETIERDFLLLHALAILGGKTPINADCGELCGARCCKGGEEDGMLLLPGEEKLLSLQPGIKIKTKMSGGRKLRYAVCGGSCIRLFRPYMCRIYPLVPYVKDGRCRVIFDPRAEYICAFAKAKKFISRDFRVAVRQSALLLMNDEKNLAFFNRLSRSLEEYARFTGSKL